VTGEVERAANRVVGPHGMDEVVVVLPYAAVAWLQGVVERAQGAILAQEPVNAAFAALVTEAFTLATTPVIEAINAEEGPPDA
jgi:hypothetical protein